MPDENQNRSVQVPDLGSRIVYNDGRAGHSGIYADVLSVDANGMMVQFEDRADMTRINFTDRAWMDFIKLVFEN